MANDGLSENIGSNLSLSLNSALSSNPSTNLISSLSESSNLNLALNLSSDFNQSLSLHSNLSEILSLNLALIFNQNLVSNPYQIYIILIILAFLGASFGSFCACFASRFAKNLPLFKSRSFCINCGKSLQIHELLPIISFIFLRGKCKNCKARISFLDLASEIMGVILIFISLFYAHTLVDFIYLSLILYILLMLSLIDIYLKAVPNFLLLALLLCAFAYKLSPNELENLLSLSENSALLNAFLFAGFLFLLKSLVKMIKNLVSKNIEESLGDADIIVLSSLAALLDFKASFIILFLTSIFSLPFFIWLKFSKNTQISSKNLGDFSKAELAFLPFISLAFVVYLFYFAIWMSYEAKL